MRLNPKLKLDLESFPALIQEPWMFSHRRVPVGFQHCKRLAKREPPIKTVTFLFFYLTALSNTTHPLCIGLEILGHFGNLRVYVICT